MSKTIIAKETTEHGSIILRIDLDSNSNTIWFNSETELRAFAFLLKQLVETDAESITIG